MNDLQAATEKICQLKGEALGMQCLMNAILATLLPHQRAAVLSEFDVETEAARVVLLNSDRVGESVSDGFETYIQSVKAREGR